ncbi:MAG: hypothetical protein HY903_04165 [Deltaproteobacteria bacterium]|nr:hypothetical protein [Deltaproteobacteria bacterium]
MQMPAGARGAAVRVGFSAWCALAPTACMGLVVVADPVSDRDGPPMETEAVSSFGCSPACADTEVCTLAGCVERQACVAAEDCGAAGMTCDLEWRRCVPADICGIESFEAVRPPPNLMLVVDRSCTMREPAETNGAETKWTITVRAITNALNEFRGQIRFGLLFFPDLQSAVANRCQEQAPQLPVGDGNEDAIQGLFARSEATKLKEDFYPLGPCITPIDTGVSLAATEPAFAMHDRASNVLLFTDGKQTRCGAAPAATRAALEAKTLETIGALFAERHIDTHVIGFGNAVDSRHLNACAAAGGAPQIGASYQYYNAADQASLDQALARIGTRVLACEYQLQKPPPSASRIFAFLDHTVPAPRDPDHQDGWDYDAESQRIVFFGPLCDQLKSGAFARLDLTLGCGDM